MVPPKDTWRVEIHDYDVKFKGLASASRGKKSIVERSRRLTEGAYD